MSELAQQIYPLRSYLLDGTLNFNGLANNDAVNTVPEEDSTSPDEDNSLPEGSITSPEEDTPITEKSESGSLPIFTLQILFH